VLVHRGLEIGRAIEILVDYYCSDTVIGEEWNQLVADHNPAVARYVGLGYEAVHSVPEEQRYILLRGVCYERLHGTTRWDVVRRQTGSELTNQFRARREALQHQLSTDPVLTSFYETLVRFAIRWGLDYPWAGEALLFRALQDLKILPQEVPDEFAELLLPDLAPSLQLAPVSWWQAGKSSGELQAEVVNQTYRWQQELRRHDFVAPDREPHQHMLWVFNSDAKGKTAVQICADPALNPKERTVRAIQEAIRRRHRDLLKFGRRRGRPPYISDKRN